MKRDELYAAMEEIRQQNKKGLLIPEEVVEAATPETHPLHSRFTWDDSIAGHRYRLWEARELIIATVTILPQDHKPIRAYVSIPDDRRSGSGGYRPLDEVISSKELSDMALKECLRELARMREKYGRIKALAGVFEAVDAVKKMYGDEAAAELAASAM